MREWLVMATVFPAEEAEPVVVEIDGDVVTLTLDDGTRLELDRVELAAALSPGSQRAVA